MCYFLSDNFPKTKVKSPLRRPRLQLEPSAAARTDLGKNPLEADTWKNTLGKLPIGKNPLWKYLSYLKIGGIIINQIWWTSIWGAAVLMSNLSTTARAGRAHTRLYALQLGKARGQSVYKLLIGKVVTSEMVNWYNFQLVKSPAGKNDSWYKFQLANFARC